MEKKQSKKKPKAEGDDGHKKNWREVYASVEDIQQFLSDRIYLRHNVITGRVEFRVPEADQFTAESGLPVSGEWQPVSDRVVNSLWAELSKAKTVRAQDIYRVMESDLVPDYHPFQAYLGRLPKWDGVSDYILEMSVSVTVKGDVEEQMLFYDYLKRWLVGMVAGWIDPKVVNNVILVLIGEQGSYKTTWFNYLLPPELSRYFYTKTNASRMGRDDLLTLAQYGLVCCEELDTMSPRDLNQLKAAVTMPSIDERAAYAHFHEHRKHIASFCGTGNNVQFLSDPTGNRRWLPFEVEHIRSPRDDPFNYEGIYSQAYALYRQGFEYWFSQAEIRRLSLHNRQFETPIQEQELIDIYFRKPLHSGEGEFMPVARALQVIGGSMANRLSPVLIGRAFTQMGFDSRLRHGLKGYLVVQRDAGEIREHLRKMACDGPEDEKPF